MRPYLVFQLCGPLASWGDIAVGETRPSTSIPSKSAIVGLLAAALGIRRPNTVTNPLEQEVLDEKHVRLAESYGLGVRVDAIGIPLSDYHTAEVPKGKGYFTRRDEVMEVNRQKRSGKKFAGTILSRREYRQDLFFATCALWSREIAPYSLDELQARLRAPCFTIYLGRKSCPPALPANPQVKSYECVEDALASMALAAAFGQISESAKIRGRMVPAWLMPRGPAMFAWDSDAETRMERPEQTVTRRDGVVSRQRWQFAVREECRAKASPKVAS